MSWLLTRGAAPCLYAVWLLASITTLMLGWVDESGAAIMLHLLVMAAISVPAVVTAWAWNLVRVRGPLMLALLPLHLAGLVVDAVPIALAPMLLMTSWCLLLLVPAWVEDRLRAALFGRVTPHAYAQMLANHAHLLHPGITNARPASYLLHLDLTPPVCGTGPFALSNTTPTLEEDQQQYSRASIMLNANPGHSSAVAYQAALSRAVGWRAFPAGMVTIPILITPPTAHGALAQAAKGHPNTAVQPSVRPTLGLDTTVKHTFTAAAVVGGFVALYAMLAAIKNDQDRTHIQLDAHIETLLATTPTSITAAEVQPLHARATGGTIHRDPQAPPSATFLVCAQAPEGVFSYLVEQPVDSPTFTPITKDTGSRVYHNNPCARLPAP